MKRVQFLVLTLIVAVFVLQGTAFAKLVSGTVDAVDSTTGKLTISQANATTGAQEKSDIWVKTDAAFAGIAAINELKAGDEVWVEAEEEGGNWKATKVTKA